MLRVWLRRIILFDKLHLESQPRLRPTEFNFRIAFQFFCDEFQPGAPLFYNAGFFENGSDDFVSDVGLSCSEVVEINGRQ